MPILTHKNIYLNEPIGLKMLNDSTAFKIEESPSVGYTEISKYDNVFLLDVFFNYTYEETRKFLFCTASQFQQLSESEKKVVIKYLACVDSSGNADTSSLTNFLVNNGYSLEQATKDISRNETNLSINSPNVYFKDTVIVKTQSNNFSSLAPINVPGLTYTIPKDGDYTFYTIINRRKSTADDVEIYFAVNGVTVIDSISQDNEDRLRVKSAQNMFIIENLVKNDVITVQMDTNGSNIELNNRRLIIQSW